MSKRKLIAIISLSLSLILFGCGTETTTSKNNKTENSTSTISSNKDNTSTETASTTIKNDDDKEDEITSNEDNKTESNLNESNNTETNSSNVDTEENTQSQSNTEESYSLSQEELEKAQAYFNKVENNGFLCSEYSNTKDISLIQLIYNGAGISEEMTEQERADYKEEIYTDITKIPKKALEDLTKNKLNTELTSINGYEEFEKNFYSEKYDCYYLQHGDTNYEAVEFVSGEKNDDGTYTFIYDGHSHVTYKESQFKLNCYVNDNVYTIISNLPIN
ncbi:MAG: hypothetical protein MSA89_04880 [Clostridium sp.]|nr:hypothetical protein [Clostridium sp.]